MTFEEIESKLEYIESIKGDDESAHSAEDDFHQDFIAYLASGKFMTDESSLEDIERKAELVLKTRHIDFARWCA